MTPDQAAAVRRTFRLVERIREQVGVLFYRRLFALDPTIALRFEGADMDGQRRALIGFLARAVDGLPQPEVAEPETVARARWPTGIGVRSEDRETAAAALLWTLAQGLGTGFTAEVEAAWRAALRLPARPTGEAFAPNAFRRPRHPAASSPRASDTPRSRHPARPA